MKTSQAARILRSAIQQGENILLVGSRGIGKTEVVCQQAHALGMDISVSHPGTENPTNAQGFPWLSPDSDHASFKPYGVLWDVLQSTQPHVWFWDDLGQAPSAVQAGYMQWAQGRRVGEHRLPDHVRIVAASNDRQHGANASMLEPLKDRFTILSVEAQWEDWITWAAEHGVHEDVMGFIAFQPALLSPEEKKPNMENSPTPRGWHGVSKWCQTPNMNREDLLYATTGRVGPGAATEFLAFRQLKDKLPDLDNWIKHPDTVVMPPERNVQYAAGAGLLSRTDPTTWPNVAKILPKFHEVGSIEVATFVLGAVLRKDKSLAETAAFSKLLDTPAGECLWAAVGV